MDSPCIKQTVCEVLKIFQYGKYLVAYVLKLPTEHHLDFLRLKGGCTGSSECHIVGNHMSQLVFFRMKRVSVHVFAILLRPKVQKAQFTKSGFFSITGYILSFSGEYSHVVYLGGKSYFTPYFIHCAHAHLIKIKKYSIVQPKCPISNKKKVYIILYQRWIQIIHGNILVSLPGREAYTCITESI